MTYPKLDMKEVFEVYLYGTGQDVLWRSAIEKKDKEMKKEIVQKFRAYCNRFGLKNSK